MPPGVRCQVLSLRAKAAGQQVWIVAAVLLPASPALADDQNYLRTGLTFRVIEIILETSWSMNAVDPAGAARSGE